MAGENGKAFAYFWHCQSKIQGLPLRSLGISRSAWFYML